MSETKNLKYMLHLFPKDGSFKIFIMLIHVQSVIFPISAHCGAHEQGPQQMRPVDQFPGVYLCNV